MAARSIPVRLRWAVETIAVQPDDDVLEIGCGRGVAVALVCERLSSGRITAIDRSATAIDAATQHNHAHVASGRAILRTMALEAADLDGQRFNKIFAINVNLFWVRRPAKELDLVRRLLKPGGTLYLFYEPPSAARADELARKLPDILEGEGFAVTVSRTTRGSAPLVGVVAQPG